MDLKTASRLRNFFLIVVIVCDSLMLACWWLSANITFFWVFVAINIAVIAGEIYNNFWGYGKTLSTQVTKTVEQGGRKATFSYLAVILLVLTMVALAAHLLIH